MTRANLVRRTGAFIVIDEAGKQHTVVEYTEMTEPDTWVPGLKSYKLLNGNHCKVLDDGTLEVLQTGAKLRPTTSPEIND